MEDRQMIELRWYDRLFICFECLVVVLAIAILFARGLFELALPGAVSFHQRTIAECALIALSAGTLAAALYSDLRFYKSTIAVIFLFIFIFLFILALNIATPMAIDDFSQMPHHGISIASVGEIFESIVHNWRNWNGRAVANLISWTMGMIGDGIFNVLNALVFCLMIYLLTEDYCKSKAYPSIVFLLFSMVWLFQPLFGQTVLWRCGSSNYLWTNVIVLLFLQSVSKTGSPVHSSRCIGLFLLGMVAGWCNESTAVSVFVFLVLEFLIESRLEHRRIGACKWAAFAGWTVGMVMLIGAPGNFIRLTTEGGGHEMGHSVATFLVQIVKQIVNMSNAMLEYFTPMIIICLFLLSTLVIIFSMKGWRKENTVFIVRAMAMIAAFLVSVYSLVLVFGVAPRALSFSACLLYILLAYLLRPLVEMLDAHGHKALSVCESVLVLFVLLSMALNFTYIVKYDYENDIRVQDVLRQKEAGNDVAYVYRVRPRTKYVSTFGLEDVNEDPAHYVNASYASWYGFDRVELLE